MVQFFMPHSVQQLAEKNSEYPSRCTEPASRAAVAMYELARGHYFLCPGTSFPGS